MLGFLGGLLRVIVGFILACLAAGAVKVLFAVTPAELIDAGTEYWQQGGVWALYTGTMIAIFALPFAALSAIFSEWQGIRSFAYHGFIGIAIAVAGFALIVTGESPDAPSIINSYAMAAFLTTGLASGFIYWLFAGRFAYRPQVDDAAVATAKPASPQPPPPPPKSMPPKIDPLRGPATKPEGSAPKSDKPSGGSGTVPSTGSKPGRSYDA